ncbi:hypothetical protein [Jiulongibacter sp. NS-SX5]|uniref:hypothetical protein n=1 Tax=Jiulongibacter sp. NS-SX5 TaxID=3463854 RepID=UPI00405A3A28
MIKQEFIEIEVQNHLILHGFDDDNQEILEEVKPENSMIKLIRIDRIQSLSAKYILTTYAFDRFVYWEYKGSYDEIKKTLKAAGVL